MRNRKVLIIIPAYNEEDNLEKVIGDVTKACPEYDYLVVNDGSTDNTGKLCRQKNIAAADLPINLGIGGAVQTGYRYAYENDYDIAVQIDGDGQHDCGYLEELLRPLLEETADVVIGSRFLKKEGFQSSVLRRTGIRMLSDLIKMCTGVRIYDVTSGFRAVNQKFIKIFAEDYPADYPEPEAIISTVMHRGRIMEVPVVMKEREGGTSSINAGRSVYYMIKVTLAILVCRISFGIRR